MSFESSNDSCELRMNPKYSSNVQEEVLPAPRVIVSGMNNFKSQSEYSSHESIEELPSEESRDSINDQSLIESDKKEKSLCDNKEKL